MFCYYFYVHNSLQWSTVDSNEAATAAETAEGRDSISTAYVGRRWYTSWSKNERSATMTSRARAGEQQLVSSSSILSITARTTLRMALWQAKMSDLNGAPVPNSDEAQWWRQWLQLYCYNTNVRGFKRSWIAILGRKLTAQVRTNKRCLWQIQQTCPIRRHWWAAQRTPFGRHTSFCSFVGVYDT